MKLSIAFATFAVCVVATGAAGAATTHSHRAHHPRAHAAHAARVSHKPPAEAARLMAFRGVWNFDGSITMGANAPAPLRWRLSCSKAAGGWGVACNDTIHIPKMGTIYEHDLFAYDATGALHFFMADNMGQVRELSGKWTDEHTLAYHYEGTQEGKPVVEDATVVLRDGTTFDLDDKVTAGGEVQMSFHGTFHKQPKRSSGAHAAAPAQPPVTPAPSEPAQ